MTRQEFYLTLGLELRARRKALGLTQSAVAKKLKKMTSFICEVENGKRPVSAYLLFRFNQELGSLKES